MALWLCGFIVSGCGSEEPDVGSGPSPAPPVTVASRCGLSATLPGVATVFGTASFISVPNDPATGALDYARSTPKPIREATVELLDASGVSLGTCVTSDSGDYAFSVSGVTGDVRVRVRAEIKKTSGAGGQWNFSVKDNTRGNAMYAMDSPLFTPVLGEAVRRDVLAGSGFDGTRYVSPRSAAPFALLDVARHTKEKLFSALSNPNSVIPSVDILWSVENKPVDGDIAVGEIGLTQFVFDFGGHHQLLVLGQEDVDTDEYDTHVVANALGDYFLVTVSTAFGRTLSHPLGDKLDMVYAFQEGWKNAWAGMSMGSPILADSIGPAQRQGGVNNLMQPPAAGNQGWYSEASVQSVLWRLHEDPAIGFLPMYKVMDGPIFALQSFPTIHAFSTFLKAQVPASAATINALLKAQNISQADDMLGGQETNDGGVPQALPLYRRLSDGPHCVTNAAGIPNKIGNYVYIRFEAVGPHTLTVSTVESQLGQGSNPEFGVLTSDGGYLVAAETFPDKETLTANLPAGTHTIQLLDSEMLFGRVKGTRCFNITLQ